jgi:hypothetical protein
MSDQEQAQEETIELVAVAHAGNGVKQPEESIEAKLAYFASRLITAKSTEESAKQQRIRIEEKLAELIPGPERGQKTVTLENGIKITVERGFNYKADTAGIDGICKGDNTQPDRFAPIKTKTTTELDVTGYEWYRDNDSEFFGMLSQFVTVTPKKVAVQVKGC